MFNIYQKLFILNSSSFNVRHFNLIYFALLLFIIIPILYLIINKLSFKIYKWLSFSHISITILGLLMLFFPTLLIKMFGIHNENNSIIETGLFITFFAQIFFLANIFYGQKKIQ